MAETVRVEPRCHASPQDHPITPIPFRLGRRTCIDGLRGVAALLVLVYHLAVVSQRINAPAFGFNGVFFVLSGFLITAILVEEWGRTGGIDLRRFAARRFMRLLPCLLLVLAAAALVFLTTDAMGFDAESLTREDENGRWLTIVASLSLLTNWSLAFDWLKPGLLRGTWSLAVEQQFYLIWPPILLLLLARRIAFRRLAIAVIVVAIGMVVYREILWQTGASWNRVYFGADTRADGILFGCAIGLLATGNLLPSGARFRRFLGGSAVLITCVIAAMVALLFLPVLGATSSISELTVRLMAPMALMTCLVLVHLVLEPGSIIDRMLSARWLGVLGQMAYPIYLWHTFYIWLCARLFGFGDGPALIVFLLTAVSAPITYYGVERPVARMRDRMRATGMEQTAPVPLATSGQGAPAVPALFPGSGVERRGLLTRFGPATSPGDAPRDLAS
jgi:peptidoglycan/LPS O-acetylase OafA/YrhL